MQTSRLYQKRILIGITGGIAAYKCYELIRRLKEQGAHVKVILTNSAKAFVTPLSLQAISGEKVYDELLSVENESIMGHIELARWAQLVLIAPASANTMAKICHGLGDDLLSTVCLATTAPVAIAPAMNQDMWQNSATQHNLQQLIAQGKLVWGPGTGSQACGEIGPGRLLEPHEILDNVIAFFTPAKLKNQSIIITAGPTQEAIDPVRYLSNYSSGKMGYALAKAASEYGAKVTLISGPTDLVPPSNVNFISVVTAEQMNQATLKKAESADIFIGCAAVADYRPVKVAGQKLKKSNPAMTLELERNPDILKNVSFLPANKRPITIGFAAETENLQENGMEKLTSKKLDMIIANSVAGGQVFGQNTNRVLLLQPEQPPIPLPSMDKDALAQALIIKISLIFQNQLEPELQLDNF